MKSQKLIAVQKLGKSFTVGNFNSAINREEYISGFSVAYSGSNEAEWNILHESILVKPKDFSHAKGSPKIIQSEHKNLAIPTILAENPKQYKTVKRPGCSMYILAYIFLGIVVLILVSLAIFLAISWSSLGVGAIIGYLLLCAICAYFLIWVVITRLNAMKTARKTGYGNQTFF